MQLELGTAELGPIACQLSDVVPRVPSWSRRPCRVLAWTDGLKVEIGYHPHDASAASLVVDTPEGCARRVERTPNEILTRAWNPTWLNTPAPVPDEPM